MIRIAVWLGEEGAYTSLISKIQDLRLDKANSMSGQNYKNTWNGFTKFVLWGTIAVIAILVILAITLL